MTKGNFVRHLSYIANADSLIFILKKLWSNTFRYNPIKIYQKSWIQYLLFHLVPPVQNINITFFFIYSRVGLWSELFWDISWFSLSLLISLVLTTLKFQFEALDVILENLSSKKVYLMEIILYSNELLNERIIDLFPPCTLLIL